jgi:hypothetical protein
MGRERSLVLTEADRARLQGWSRRRKTAGPGTALTHHPALREWLDGDGLSSELGVCIQTVSKWWRRYCDSGPDGLLDEPRPGQPRKLSDAQVEAVIARSKQVGQGHALVDPFLVRC